jgi:hypothetical protein
MFAWWTLVGSNPTRTEFTFDNDPRFVAALGAVLEQSAERLGISEEALHKLHAAAREAWQSCWRGKHDGHQKLHLECEETADHIELIFRCPSGAEREIEICAAELKAKVEHVTVEKQAGKPHLKITAYAKKH